MSYLPAECIKKFEELVKRRKKDEVSFTEMIQDLQQKGFWVKVSNKTHKDITPDSICVIVVNLVTEQIYRILNKKDIIKATQSKDEVLILIPEKTALKWKIPYAQ